MDYQTLYFLLAIFLRCSRLREVLEKLHQHQSVVETNYITHQLIEQNQKKINVDLHSIVSTSIFEPRETTSYRMGSSKATTLISCLTIYLN